VAFALREQTWKLGCTSGPGQQPRERPVAARHQARVLHEVAQAKKRCGLPDTAPVVRCDEAGRDGFWRHRFLHAQGITHSVVDSSAIAVKRRQRRATSDGLDVRKWLRMLRRDA
jgi:transposase